MPLILPRCVILLPPRTGSTWIRQAIRNAGINFRDLNPKHATTVPPQNPPLPFVPKFTITFTREAATWLPSRWLLGPWEDELADFWDIDPEKFRANVNDGMVAMYFAKYTSQASGKDAVGRFEDLANELVRLLRLAGEDFDETSLRDTPKINERPADGLCFPDVYWKMNRDRLNSLPAEHISRLPVELLSKLTENTLARLPADALSKLVPKLAKTALTAGSASVGGR